MFIANLKVRNKLLVLIGIVILGFIGLLLFGMGTVNRVKVGGKLYAEIKSHRDTLEMVGHVKADLNEIRVLFTTMLSTADRDALNRLRNNIKELTSNINEEFDETVSLIREEEIAAKTALTSAQFTWTEFANTIENEYFPAIFSGDNVKALELAMGVQKLRQHRFVEQVDSAESIIRFKTEELEESANEIVKKSIVFLILGSTILVLVIIFFAWLVSMSITKPLHELATVVAVIGKGDLSQRAEIKTRDEIGVLATSFNKMAKDLSGAMEKEKKLAAAAAAAESEKKKAEELASLNEELESTNEEIKQANEELESSAEELRVANEEAQKAKEVAEKKAAELEKFNKVAVGRELKMKELKARIAELEAKLSGKS